MNRMQTAFLPAALEIEATPPSPLGRALVGIIVAFFTLAFTWASVSEVEIVAVAGGRIIPSGHSKSVQPLEIGTVKAIHVDEGQPVRAGDVLVELDAVTARADVARLEQEADDAQDAVIRNRALADWIAAGVDQDEPAARDDDALLQRQRVEFQDRLRVLTEERGKRSAERNAAARRLEKLDALLPIVTRRAQDHKGLAEQKLLPEQQYLDAEQARLELYHEQAAQRDHIVELEAAVTELDARIGFTRSEFHRQVVERRLEAERRYVAASQELVKARHRAVARTLTAPVDGVVQQLTVRNPGAVVTPAQELMVIVPNGAVLEVEAILENRDIGFVTVGQRAAIKVDAFPFTRYGTIEGEIVDVSDDAIADDRRGLVYRMRVRMERSAMDVEGRNVGLGPGMTVTVEVQTGTRRLIEFFLSPLLRYQDESVRER